MKKLTGILTVLLCVSVLFINVCGYADASNGTSLNLTAKGAILIDIDTDTILYKKNINEEVRPASLTKMMTLLVAYEQNKDKLDTKVTVTKEMIDVPSGSSKAELCEGDIITVKDLLYAMMLPSGNDAAQVLAFATSGTEEEFTKLMNAKASEIGMKNTQYKNAHGFDETGHYTTTYDLALISEYLCNIPELVEIFSSYKYTVTVGTNGDENNTKSYEYYNTNTMLNPNASTRYDGLKGIKTGFTQLAGNCLASYYEKDGRRMVAVVTFSDQGNRDNDTKILFNYGKNSFDTIDKNAVFTSKRVIVDAEKADPSDESNGQLELYLEPDPEGGYMTLPKDIATKIRTFQENTVSVRYPTVTAPVRAGDYVGDVEFVYNNEVIYRAKALASRTVDADITSPADLVSLGLKGKIRISFGFLTNKYFLVPVILIIALAVIVYSIIKIKQKREARVRSNQRNVTRKRRNGSRPGNRML